MAPISRARAKPAPWKILAGLALLAVFALHHAASFKAFPNLNGDEAMESNHAYNILTRGENRYSLYEDIFPPKFEVMLYSLPNVLRPIYNLGLAAAFKLAGLGPWQARGFSLACALGSLLIAAWLAWRWTGSFWAVLACCGFLGFHTVFTLSSHEARPEAMLGLFACLSFLLLDLSQENPWWAALAGLCAALAPGIHTNGAAVALASAAVVLLRARSRWLYFALGAAAGGAAVLTLVRPELFLPGWVMFDGFFSYRPPVHHWGWNLAGEFGSELRRYLAPRALGYDSVSPALFWALRMEWAAFFGAWLSSWWLHRDGRMRALLWWIGILFLFYTLFVSNKNPNYASVFEPFLALLLTVFVHRALVSGGARPPLKGALVPAAAGAALLGLGAPFFLVPVLFITYLLEGKRSGAVRSQDLYLFVLLSILPVFSLRVYAPDAFFAALRDGWAVLGSWPGAAAAAAALAVLALRGRAAGAREVPGWKPGTCGHLAPAVMSLALAFSLGGVGLVHAYEVFSRARTAADFDAVAADIRANVGEGGRILGPQLLWFAFPGDSYRDWDALSYARWLTGREDLTPYLMAWRPDYLLVDRRFRTIFLRRHRLEDVIRVPLSKVAETGGGEAFFQPIEVFRFDWERMRSPGSAVPRGGSREATTR